MQVHKFIKGFPAVAPMARVGSAAGTLLSIPIDQLRGKESSSSTPLSRQLQRSLTGGFPSNHSSPWIASLLSGSADALLAVQDVMEMSCMLQIVDCRMQANIFSKCN